MVIWFTGLSGSGKSTLSKMLANFLNDRGEAVLLLDGDKIRSTMHKGLDFSSENIKINSHAIINLCKEKESLHDYIVVSVIAPFEETRKYARKILGKNYIEIFVKASLKELIRRDTKGLYKKALNGELVNLIGIDPGNPYQIPKNPDLTIDTDIQTENQSFNRILTLV
jgi:adenylyl-sulfate kinase|tara:strand:- start:3788 stop:4291 length:504 start_codon:yes stop_codon:yes gene_type:complete